MDTTSATPPSRAGTPTSTGRLQRAAWDPGDRRFVRRHGDLWWRLFLWSVLAVMILAGAAYRLAGWDVMGTLPSLPACTFHALTGLPCPGCGMTRAMISLGQLRPLQAFRYHPFAFVLAGALLLALGRCRWPSRSGRWWAAGVIAALALVFWVVRLSLFLVGRGNPIL